MSENDEKHHLLSKDEIRTIAEEAALKAVSQVLNSLGIDPTKTIESQEDMMFLRRLRRCADTVAAKIGITIVAIIITLTLTFIGLGVSEWFRQKMVTIGIGVTSLFK